MICYRDMTFCVTPGCKKEHAYTGEVMGAAKRAGLPCSLAYLCGEEPIDDEEIQESPDA